MLFSGVFAIIVRSITTASLITAVVLDAVAQPNLRSWSCVSKQFEQDFRDNTIGFESVCFDLVSVPSRFSLSVLQSELS
jgi:hypothetical protein